MEAKRNKNLIFVEQFFYPEAWGGVQLTRDFCRTLNEVYKVKVFSGTRQLIEGNDIENVNPESLGIDLIKIRSLLKRPKNLFQKLIDNIYFSLRVFLKILFVKNADVIFVQTNPPPILISIWLVCCLKRIPYVINCWDIYPEVLVAHKKLKPSIVLNLISFFFSLAYKNAKFVFSLGPEMRKCLIKKGVNSKKLVYLPTWATGDLKNCKPENNFLIKEWDAKAKIRIVYSGNLGLAHNALPFLEALSKCNISKNKLQMFFVTKGQSVQEAINYVAKNNLQNLVTFKDPVNSSLMPKVMSLSNLGFVCIRDGFEGLVNPSKVAGYLARGLPIIYVGPPSDVSDLIKKANCGFSFTSNDIRGITKFLNKLARSEIDLLKLSINATNYYQETLSFKKARIKIKKIFKEV
tara:strand:+ start:881 stop:2098 length:1218 start_codon:yes stop_codon:yes gene_type:complete